MKAEGFEEIQRYVESIPPEDWFSAAHWAKVHRQLEPWQRALLFSVGRYKINGWTLSVKQCQQGAKAYTAAIALGYDSSAMPAAPLTNGAGTQEAQRLVTQSFPPLQCPVRLPPGYPRLIVEHVEELITGLPSANLYKIADDARLYLAKLAHSRTAWVRTLAWYAKLLALVLETLLNSGLDILDPSVRAAAGALLYVLDHEDVISDYTPGIGLADDAYAVASAVKLLDRERGALLAQLAMNLPRE